MRRFTFAKITLTLAGFAALAVFAAAIGFVMLDESRYQQTIVAVAEQATGREIKLADDIDLHFSLTPSISIEGLTIANAEWAEEPHFATIDNLRMQVRLLPFALGKIVIKRFELAGVRVNLETDEQGRTNWTNAGGSGAETDSEALGTFADTVIHDLDIADLTIRYRAADASTTEIRLNEIAVASDGIDEPMRVRLDAHVLELPLEVAAELAPLATYLSNATASLDVAGVFGPVEFTMAGELAAPLEFGGINIDVRSHLRSPDAHRPGLTLPAAIPVDSTLTFTLRDRDAGMLLDDVELALGGNRISGSVGIAWGGERPFVTARLGSERIDLSPGGQAPDAVGGRAGRLLSTAPLPFDWFANLDAELEWQIAGLAYRQLELAGVSVAVELEDSELRSDFATDAESAAVINGALAVTAVEQTPTVTVSVAASGVPLAAITDDAERFGLRGGPLAITTDLSGSGGSVAAILGSSDGLITMNMGPASLDSGALAAVQGDLINSLSGFIETGGTERTSITCAAVRFPVDDGMLRSKYGIGVQTDRINILGGGTINLKDERIDIGVEAKSRSGTGLSLSNFADFVRIGGTLSEPRPTTDLEGATTAGLKVGAAFATAGLSIVAEGLFDRATADENVCELIANPARAAAKPSAAETVTTRAGSAIETAGNKVKSVFGRLFGRD